MIRSGPKNSATVRPVSLSIVSLTKSKRRVPSPSSEGRSVKKTPGTCWITPSRRSSLSRSARELSFTSVMSRALTATPPSIGTTWKWSQRAAISGERTSYSSSSGVPDS